jgi:two-component system, OmpR family, sensor kinase
LLNNLVENALRFTTEGGVVDVDVALLGGRPTLKVIDSGPGIAESERERVFARFYRVEEATGPARDASGSGLGLAIVAAIAERHGAAVTLHTAASGRGLEVRVVFPPVPA